MKNKSLILKLKDLKNSKSLEVVEGSMLLGIKGGTDGLSPECGTKCKPNSACNGNNPY